MLDRHRILHCTAFRRLQYKTQVFLRWEADHFRTRLTHTLEAAHLGRKLAGRLEANDLLAEVTALAHDLGHGPFGHASERALNKLTQRAGGFEHNAQTLRLVTYLEHPYPHFIGLNLTNATLSCLRDHSSPYDQPDTTGDDHGYRPMLEAQIASIADRLAYDAGDLEDAITLQLINSKQLQQLDLWQQAAEQLDLQNSDLPTTAICRAVVEQFQAILIDAYCQNYDSSENLLNLPGPLADSLTQLERFLTENVYQHERVKSIDAACYQVIEQLFGKFICQVDLLGSTFAARIQTDGLERTVADYIAGMTDRYCLSLYRQLFGTMPVNLFP